MWLQPYFQASYLSLFQLIFTSTVQILVREKPNSRVSLLALMSYSYSIWIISCLICYPDIWISLYGPSLDHNITRVCGILYIILFAYYSNILSLILVSFRIRTLTRLGFIHDKNIYGLVVELVKFLRINYRMNGKYFLVREKPEMPCKVKDNQQSSRL